MSNYVGVYGTLRKGGALNGHMKPATLVNEGVVQLPYRMVNVGWYPALTDANELHPIYLEVYEVDDDMMVTLDAVEGAPELYHRKQVTAFGKDVTVYVFTHQDNLEGKEEITSGDFSETGELFRETPV